MLVWIALLRQFLKKRKKATKNAVFFMQIKKNLELSSDALLIWNYFWRESIQLVETTIVTSSFPVNSAPLEKEPVLKGMNLLSKEKFLPLMMRKVMTLKKSCLPFKCISSPSWGFFFVLFHILSVSICYFHLVPNNTKCFMYLIIMLSCLDEPSCGKNVAI